MGITVDLFDMKRANTTRHGIAIIHKGNVKRAIAGMALKYSGENTPPKAERMQHNAKIVFIIHIIALVVWRYPDFGL